MSKHVVVNFIAHAVMVCECNTIITVSLGSDLTCPTCGQKYRISKLAFQGQVSEDGSHYGGKLDCEVEAITSIVKPSAIVQPFRPH